MEREHRKYAAADDDVNANVLIQLYNSKYTFQLNFEYNLTFMTYPIL